jgi:5-aminolevulinate synthase
VANFWLARPEPASPFFDCVSFCNSLVAAKKRDNTYRYLNDVNRIASSFPKAHLASHKGRSVTVWCTTDCLGLSTNQEIIEQTKRTLDLYGTGSGGSRTVAGHNKPIRDLETTCAKLHAKEAALVFSSCYNANEAALSTLGMKLPNCTILSDSENHASLIQGARNSRTAKIIFEHNNIDDLEEKLASLPLCDPKIIVFESLYSMSGAIAPIEAFCRLARKYGAITFLDETHAVGMYGPHGAGVAEHLDFVAHLSGQPSGTIMDQVDIIAGSLGKAYGSMGGYIASSTAIIDTVRSFSPGFIFTTSPPPALMAGTRSAVEQMMKHDSSLWRLHQLHTAQVKRALASAGIPITPNQTHIVPVLVGDARKAQQASEMLLEKWGIYVQAINFPTVKYGDERLRLNPTPGHGPQLQAEMVEAMTDVWRTLDLKTADDWLREGRIVVGKDESIQQLWTEEQYQCLDAARANKCGVDEVTSAEENDGIAYTFMK